MPHRAALIAPVASTARVRRRSRPVFGLVAAAVILALTLAGLAPAVRAETPRVLDPRGTSVAAYGGWSAWSRADSTTGRYALVTRSPHGVISLPPVAESASPFDVELGPTSGAGVAAVYSRCSDTTTHDGCRIVALTLGLAAAAERPLTPPGGGSDHAPAIWHGDLVFLRRTPSGGARRPDSLLEWRIGSRNAHALALPRSRGSGQAGLPAGLTGAISGLSFNGKQVGYVTNNEIGSMRETTLWFEPLGGRPELIDQETGGAGDVCPAAFLSPVLAGRWLYAYLHACDPSANPRLDRLTRYRRGEVQTAAYTFIQSGDEAISSAVLDGAGVDWGAEHGLERVARVSWRRVRAPVPQSFCGRADPFC